MVDPRGHRARDSSTSPFVRSIRRGVHQAGDVALLLTAGVDAGVESSVALDSAILNAYDQRLTGAALSASNPLFDPCPDMEAAKLLGRIVAEQAFAFTLAVQVIAETKGISVGEVVQLLNSIVEG